jgi:hypothetical protein
MSLKEQVTQALEELSEAELAQLIESLAFLKFRARLKALPTLEEAQLATLYAEFAEEDWELAEEGIADYASGLLQEDAL